MKIKTGKTKSVTDVLDKLEKKRLTINHCHPYCSSERGSNEKQNGMTRRYHPKGTDFGKVSKKKLRETTERINNKGVLRPPNRQKYKQLGVKYSKIGAREMEDTAEKACT